MKQLMKDTNLCSDDIIRAFISLRAKDRFPGIESDRRGPCRKRGLDKFDPDPVIHWQDLKMGRTPASRLGKSPPEPSGSSDDLTLLEKKKKQPSSSPSKTTPDAPALASSTPHPEALILEPTGTTPTPPSSQGPPAATPKPPPAAPKITQFLKPGASRGKAVDGSASSGSQSLVLHVGPAAAAVPEKPSGLLGRIVELKREGKDLGHLLPYAQKWNDADISASTRGLGKDRLPAPDPAGPRSTEEHFRRLKRAVKEFDSAWYDATSNVVSTADARKQLFEELLWEHRYLAEAHSHCQAVPEATIEALKTQLAAAQEEKDRLALKAAESAAEARLNEALEDADNANVVLRAELEEAAKAQKAAEGKATKAQKAAEDKVARLEAEQKEYDLLVTRTDTLALRTLLFFSFGSCL
nr:auxilin-related protein 2-like [Lolium perenne]